MRYLLLSDLDTSIKDYDLEDILESTTLVQTGNTTLDTAENIAIDTCFAYIGSVYDKDVELAKTGDTRDFFVIDSVISILKHTLYQRVSSSSIPEHIQDGFQQTIENLQNIQGRKVQPKITKRDVSDTKYVARIYTDSNVKSGYSY